MFFQIQCCYTFNRLQYSGNIKFIWLVLLWHLFFAVVQYQTAISPRYAMPVLCFVFVFRLFVFSVSLNTGDYAKLLASLYNPLSVVLISYTLVIYFFHAFWSKNNYIFIPVCCQNFIKHHGSNWKYLCFKIKFCCS